METPIQHTSVVGVSGFAQAGKDTVGRILRNYGFNRVAFADKLRQSALGINPIIGQRISSLGTIEFVRLGELVDQVGWELAKRNEEVRSFLQRLGTEGARNVFGQDFWVRMALDELDLTQKWVVTDVRFPEEAEAIKALGGVIIRVERPGTGAVNGHASETALSEWTYDGVIINDGTVDELEDIVVDMLSRFGVDFNFDHAVPS